MAYNHTLKYRTFDALLADAASDFKKYQLQSLIDPQDMIKVATRVNYDLGMRIHQTREVVLEVEKGKVRLPNDFVSLNFILAVGKKSYKQSLPQGTHVEERIVGSVSPEYVPAPPETIDLCEVPLEEDCKPCQQCGEDKGCKPCNACCKDPDSCTLTCKGDVMQLVQVTNFQTHTYEWMEPVKILQNTENINGFCPNLYWESSASAVIRDGWINTSFDNGKIYINYEGALEDEEGNLLVPDHPFLNEYYEYAIKQRLIENLIMNDEEVNPNKMQLIEQRYRAARNNALSVVNTPNFGELKELFQANRTAQWSKYYDMFASSSRLKMKKPNFRRF